MKELLRVALRVNIVRKKWWLVDSEVVLGMVYVAEDGYKESLIVTEKGIPEFEES